MIERKGLETHLGALRALKNSKISQEDMLENQEEDSEPKKEIDQERLKSSDSAHQASNIHEE